MSYVSIMVSLTCLLLLWDFLTATFTPSQSIRGFSVVVYVRTDKLVFDSGRFYSLLVNCCLGAFSVTFLLLYILVLNNLPVTLLFRFYMVFGCTNIRLRVVWGRCGHPVFLQYPIKTLWCTFHVWDDDLASVVRVLFSLVCFCSSFW